LLAWLKGWLTEFLVVATARFFMFEGRLRLVMYSQSIVV
jgi:hypothetical protein